MSGRAKHAQRSHRSYHTNMAMAHAAVKARCKERGTAIANIVRAAKNRMTHRTTEK